MTDDSGWFVERTTYERTIKHPSGAEATVTFRPLNAGDRAELNEIRLLSNEDGSGSGKLEPGRMQILAVARAVVSWTIPGPGPSEESIQQLDPRVFDELYKNVSFGNPPAEEAKPESPLHVAGERRAEASS